jgi:hypothetical protein
MSKYTTDNTRHFSVFFLNKYHNFKCGERAYNRNIIWSRNDNETGRINYDLLMDQDDPRIILKYKSRMNGETDWVTMEYYVALEAVKCHFGGVRWYFTCPDCTKRIAVLYADNHLFTCRKCAKLTYDSCQQSKRMRGFPWKTLENEWKADAIYKTLKQTHYKGKPTKKYERCLNLWSTDKLVHLAEKQQFNSYNENI